jgi:hypothetical protein
MSKMMIQFLSDFKATLDSTEKALLIYNEEESLEPYSHGKWNKKEVISHLIDSACNNHYRFITAQFKDDLVFPNYHETDWVKAQAATEQSWRFLVSFWKNYNLHLYHLLSNIPDEIVNRTVIKHNFDFICWRPIPSDEPVNLKYLIKDYYGHLKHHLSQILT